MDLFESHFSLLQGDLNLYEKDGKFEMFGDGIPRHVNYSSFKAAFEELTKIKEPIIIETGSSYAGTKSTNLFDSYIRKYGGRFFSVDINASVISKLRGEVSPGTTLVCDDSVEFLSEFSENYPGLYPNFVYLDSYDIDWYNPEPSERHGYNEYIALKPLLKSCFLLIDDTPSSPYWIDSRGELYDYLVKSGSMPGKGRLIVEEVDSNPSFQKIHQYYQAFYKITHA